MLQEREIVTLSLCEKFPNMEFFLVHIFPHSVRMQENTDQKKLRIWKHFTQCVITEINKKSWIDGVLFEELAREIDKKLFPKEEKLL